MTILLIKQLIKNINKIKHDNIRDKTVNKNYQ